MESRLNSAFTAATSARKVPGTAAMAFSRAGDILYSGAFGSTNIDDPAAPTMTLDTPLMIWSCTKLVASVAALQLVEQGKLALDDLAEKYVPDIAQIQLLDGFDGEGKPIMRAPQKKPTILQLFTHTAGFSYDFFDEDTGKWRASTGQTPSGYVAVGGKTDFESPLIFEPGERYAYGVNIDWLGFVVEAISGTPLENYIEANILKPLGMKNTGAQVVGPTKLAVHFRGEDGSLVANPALAAATSPYKYGGGHYLYSTLNDYTTFLIALLNNGTHPVSKAKILEESTVKQYLFQDQIPKICGPDGIGVVKSINPILSINGELMPGVKKGWSCGLMMNLEASPKGRSQGSGAWAGLGNLYYWLDPVEGKGGMIVTAILPFMDREILHLFDEVERAVYGHESAKEVGEVGANWGILSAA